MSQVAHLYKITNKVTGEYYLGKHNGWTQKDYVGRDYWGSGYRIQNQIKKYGKNNFTYQILVIGEVDYIYELEKKYVTTEMVDLDENCLNLTVGGMGVNYHTKESRQKLSNARAKQVFTETSLLKRNASLSLLIWMNDGNKSYRIKPDNVQTSKEKGLVEGRLLSYVDDKYRDTFKRYAKKQWQKVKETGHTGNLVKVN
jgi:hypothetical protein